jgi:hypothetical protein
MLRIKGAICILTNKLSSPQIHMLTTASGHEDKAEKPLYLLQLDSALPPDLSLDCIKRQFPATIGKDGKDGIYRGMDLCPSL